LRKTLESSAPGFRELARARQRSLERSALRAPGCERPETQRRRAVQVTTDVRARLGPSRACGAEGARAMFHAARALPAGPEDRDEDVFPIRERLRFRDNLGLGLRDLRKRPAFVALARGPWQVFIAIACYWQANAEAWPSQETIATFTGYSSRAVRDYVDVLERFGVVRLRRERRPSGTQRIYYAPGLVTLIELAAFVERFPRGPAKGRTSRAPEAASGTPPEASSRELRDQDQEPSSCETLVEAPSTPSRAPEEQQVEVAKEDVDIARLALAERMAKKHPTRLAPRWFEAGEVAMVAACVAALAGDAEAKMIAQRDAIAGAFLLSMERPPTVRFIWEKLDHFLDHLERGRRRRLAEERAAARSMAEDAPQPTPARYAVPDDVLVELQNLFGAGWVKSHVSR
jgi:hypothetical protein